MKEYGVDFGDKFGLCLLIWKEIVKKGDWVIIGYFD